MDNLYSIALLRRLNLSDDLHCVEEVCARHSRHLSSSLVAVKVAAMVVYGASAELKMDINEPFGIQTPSPNDV